uniref:C2H2-type zinc-finger protein n=1 Tax=Musca domestica TaxID=7370 RepID=T1PEX7_MUSDO
MPQQQQQQLQQQQAFAAASSAALNMDFSLALKVAAAKNQQDSPLAIDLSGMKHNIAALNSPAQRSSVGGTNTAAKATSAASTQHLPPEYQYRLIYYCNRCPARYAQKHNDPLTAKNDLDEHLRQHEPFPNNPDDPRKCLCDYCDYRAAHENLIQAHRHVHTSQYQEKCNELYKNCKDDTVYRAPKLMHITATRKQHQHETIWVVDQDLNEGHIIKMGGQNSSITSSSANAGFEVGNSLLKKQLESKQSSPQNVNEMTHKDDKEESNAPASMSPDISEMENSLEKPSGRESNSPSHVSDNVEKCQHCPFESSLRSEFKTHIQQHICVSQLPLAYTCEHCDYTAEEQDHIDEHTRIHFNSMEKLKDVAFFTSYDKLELSMEQPLNEEEEDKDAENEENNQNEKAKETGNENNLELNIKKEITANNNNDEDRVNENLKQASNPNTNTTTNNEASTSTNPDENKSQKCAKIILYKNDGCLSIKKENNSNNNETEHQDQQQQQNSSSSSNSQNISERLRRRISRPSGNAISSSSANNNNNSTSDDQQQQQQSTTTTSHKTILVNAKTGQVISRN